MRALPILCLVSAGCVSWSQADPPPRSRWLTAEVSCDPGSSPAITALVLSAVSGGMAALLLTTTEGGAFAPEPEELLGALLIPVSIGYLFDAVNAHGDASQCRAFRRYARTRGSPKPP